MKKIVHVYYPCGGCVFDTRQKKIVKYCDEALRLQKKWLSSGSIEDDRNYTNHFKTVTNGKTSEK